MRKMKKKAGVKFLLIMIIATVIFTMSSCGGPEHTNVVSEREGEFHSLKMINWGGLVFDNSKSNLMVNTESLSSNYFLAYDDLDSADNAVFGDESNSDDLYDAILDKSSDYMEDGCEEFSKAEDLKIGNMKALCVTSSNKDQKIKIYAIKSYTILTIAIESWDEKYSDLVDMVENATLDKKAYDKLKSHMGVSNDDDDEYDYNKDSYRDKSDMDDDEITNAIICAEKIIRDNLKYSPNKAKISLLPDNWTITAVGDEYNCGCEFQAINSSGTLETKQAAVSFRMTDSGFSNETVDIW